MVMTGRRTDVLLFYTFSIQLLDAGRAEQNLEKLATCTIFSQKACVKLLLDFSRICDIIILVKRTEKQTDKQSDLSKQNFKKPLTSATKCGIIKTVKELIKIFYGAQHKKYLKKFLTNTAKCGIIKIVRNGKHFERN